MKYDLQNGIPVLDRNVLLDGSLVRWLVRSPDAYDFSRRANIVTLNKCVTIGVSSLLRRVEHTIVSTKLL